MKNKEMVVGKIEQLSASGEFNFPEARLTDCLDKNHPLVVEYVKDFREENQLLKEQLEATEKMYQGALALLTAKEEKLEIATKALNSVINQNDGYSSVKIATRAVEKLLTEIGESDDK